MKQIVLFVLVGVATLCVDVAVATGTYNILHTSAYLASALGFLAGFFISFPLNRKKVFHHSDNDKFSLHTQVVLYLSLSLFNLLATSVLVGLVVTGDILKIEYAKVFATGLIATWNFFIFKLYIFSKRR